jgi:primosomal protein N' (replication factor Y)
VIARVLPDLPAVDRPFDYLVPDPLGAAVRVGSIVRVDLHGRRVRGWVVDVGAEVAPGVDPAKLKPIAKLSSQGPPPELVELAAWAAWRWAGRWVHLLRPASPPANVATPVPPAPPGVGGDGAVEVVRVPPAADRLPLIEAAVAEGPAIVVVPGVDLAERLVRRLRRDGHRVALATSDSRADDYTLAASGSASVVGTRVAVWAPVPHAALRSILVVDEHDESLQSEQAPTWHARDVAVERARRAGVACRLVSPVPTIAALDLGPLTVPPGERGGWPIVDVADRREEDPTRSGLFSPALVDALRRPGRVVCVLNRLGRARLLACVACGQVADCERCGSAVAQPDDERLRCGHCGTERPLVCSACGGGRFKNLRMGVTRAAEELAALAGEPVAEVTAAGGGDASSARVAIGTEAVLHDVAAGSVGTVAFLDLDQELLAPRYRAAEQAMALLARAGRAVGDRAAGGRLVLQTRHPEHPVVRAALFGDPARVVDAERPRRQELRLPPFGAVATVSGAGAEAWVAEAPEVLGVEVLDGGDGRWLVRAAAWDELADYLDVVPRPAARTRIEVDPPRL